MWFAGMNLYEKQLTMSFVNRFKQRTHKVNAQSHTFK
jgi:hypothetical protein